MPETPDPWTIPSDTVDPSQPEEVNGRFRIKCPDGKQRLYSRCTTYIDTLEDKTTLTAWKRRTDMVGIQTDVSLWHRLQGTEPTDKDGLNALVDEAFRAGDGYLKAQKGTDLHRLCEQWDKLEALEPHSPADLRDVEAYVGACMARKMRHLHIEQRIVVDRLKVTGTPDRISEYLCLDGIMRNVIVDLKTGSVDYGIGKMAMQETVYAEGLLYDHATGTRTPLPNVSREVGVIIHVAQGTGVARVYEVNLHLGAMGVALSGQVRGWRNYSKKAFTEVPL